MQRLSNLLGRKFPKILHVGAHKGEEIDSYIASKNGIERLVWIESDPLLCANLQKEILNRNLSGIHRVIEATIWSKGGIEMVMHVASNSMSSSLLEPDTHLESYPSIKFESSVIRTTETLDAILGSCEFDMLNLDIQGAELEALRGFKKGLSRGIELIYTEVNRKELYKGCAKLTDITNYLSQQDYRLVGVAWDFHGWGDAVYLRRNIGISEFRVIVLQMLLLSVSAKNMVMGITINILRFFLTKVRFVISDRNLS